MWRFLMAVVVVTLLSSIGLGKLFDILHLQSLQNAEQSGHQAIEAQAILLHAALTSLPNTHWKQLITTSDAQVAGYSYDLVDLKNYPLPATLNAELIQHKVLILETADQLQAYIRLPDHHILLVSANHTSQQHNPSLMMTLAFYSALILMILVFLAPFAFRLRTLSKATQRLGSGQLHYRVKVGSVWYLKELETAFNTMAERIENLLADIKLLANGLSHELRTPLTRVRMGLDTLAETDDPALRTSFENKINANLDAMESLLNQLLSFARLQYNLTNTTKTEIDINILLQQMAPTFATEPITFEYADAPCLIAGDTLYCKILISNLISNAAKYAKSQVLVSVHHVENRVQLSVSDDGAGIPEQEKHKIFQPFVRLENQPQQVKTGYGIGLAFVSRIADWLNSEIKVERCEKLGGAKFLLQFSTDNKKQRS